MSESKQAYIYKIMPAEDLTLEVVADTVQFFDKGLKLYLDGVLTFSCNGYAYLVNIKERHTK